MTGEPRQMEELSRAESLRLLSTVSFGRVGFTIRGLQAIRPVNHLMEGGRVIIRTREWSDLVAVAGGGGATVAYQADEIDPDLHLGWSVIVRGRVQAVSDADEAARYRERLSTWAAGQRDHVLFIEPEFVSGIRLVEATASPAVE
jgi:nitroimidazol reductase NimA-like FMN-containing flavoprotein (pyridoxamine 5'-phosphate oxidase superfamily)